jgi:hypothetical protein
MAWATPSGTTTSSMPRCVPATVCSLTPFSRRDAHPRAGAGQVVVETPASEPRREARVDLQRQAPRPAGRLLRERTRSRQCQSEKCVLHMQFP